MPWSLPCQVSPDWHYVDANAYDTITANIRQESFGAIACLADADPGVDYTYGLLSMELGIQLCDLAPMAPENVLSRSAPASSDEKQPSSRGVDEPVMVSSEPAPSVGSGSTVFRSSSLTASPAVSRR